MKLSTAYRLAQKTNGWFGVACWARFANFESNEIEAFSSSRRRVGMVAYEAWWINSLCLVNFRFVAPKIQAGDLMTTGPLQIA